MATVDLSSSFLAFAFCRPPWLLVAMPMRVPRASHGSHSVVNLWIPYGTCTCETAVPEFVSTLRRRLHVLLFAGRDPLGLSFACGFACEVVALSWGILYR